MDFDEVHIVQHGSPTALRGPLLKYFKVGCIFVGCHQIVVLLTNLGEWHWFAIH